MHRSNKRLIYARLNIPNDDLLRTSRFNKPRPTSFAENGGNPVPNLDEKISVLATFPIFRLTGRPGPLQIGNFIRQERAVAFDYFMVCSCITNNDSLRLERCTCGRSNGTNERATRSAGHIRQPEYSKQPLLCPGGLSSTEFPPGMGQDHRSSTCTSIISYFLSHRI
jgi:hypothetical protein